MVRLPTPHVPSIESDYGAVIAPHAAQPTTQPTADALRTISRSERRRRKRRMRIAQALNGNGNTSEADSGVAMAVTVRLWRPSVVTATDAAAAATATAAQARRVVRSHDAIVAEITAQQVATGRAARGVSASVDPLEGCSDCDEGRDPQDLAADGLGGSYFVAAALSASSGDYSGQARMLPGDASRWVPEVARYLHDMWRKKNFSDVRTPRRTRNSDERSRP